MLVVNDDMPFIKRKIRRKLISGIKKNAQMNVVFIDIGKLIKQFPQRDVI